MPQRILHASTVCTHASTYRKDANTWSALRNRCRHMSTSIPGRPHHHRLPAPTATSRATGGLMLHSRGVPIARISLSCAIAPASDSASPPPPAPPQTPSAPATAPPTPPPHHSSRARAVVARRSCACAQRTSSSTGRGAIVHVAAAAHACCAPIHVAARTCAVDAPSVGAIAAIRGGTRAAPERASGTVAPGVARVPRRCTAALQCLRARPPPRSCLERRPVVDDA